MSKMKIFNLPLLGLNLIKATPFMDERGRFARLFCAKELQDAGIEMVIVQVNHSVTRKVGAIRGMHFQRPPHAEIKIVRCLRGKCFDVAVDLRPDSATYLKWHGEVLSGDDEKALRIPEGFAHGFQVLEENTELLYFHSEYYAPRSEGGVRFDDPAIGINWPLPATDISARDKSYPLILAD